MNIKNNDKLDKFGEFTIYKFLGDDEKKERTQWLRTGVRLSDFINLDLNKNKEVKHFCEKYHFFISISIKETVEKIRDIQTDISNLVKKSISNTLTSSDINYINKYVVNKKTLIKMNDDKYYAEWNKIVNPIQPDEEIRKSPVIPKYFISEVYSADPITHLYLDLVAQITKKQTIKECPNCGRFFPFRRKDQKFCGSNCEHNFGERKRRSKNR